MRGCESGDQSLCMLESHAINRDVSPASVTTFKVEELEAQRDMETDPSHGAHGGGESLKQP